MGKCICSSCKNLKSIINSEEEAGEYECKFGYPSEKCEDCDDDNCQEVCSNYISDETVEEIKIVKCSLCGKGIEKFFKDDGNNEEVTCIECYLKQNS